MQWEKVDRGRDPVQARSDICDTLNIFGSSAKQAKQGWQGLEMQLEGAFLGRRARLWVIFGRQARLELSGCVHLVQCC